MKIRQETFVAPQFKLGEQPAGTIVSYGSGRFYLVVSSAPHGPDILNNVPDDKVPLIALETGYLYYGNKTDSITVVRDELHVSNR